MKKLVGGNLTELFSFFCFWARHPKAATWMVPTQISVLVYKGLRCFASLFHFFWMMCLWQNRFISTAGGSDVSVTVCTFTLHWFLISLWHQTFLNQPWGEKQAAKSPVYFDSQCFLILCLLLNVRFCITQTEVLSRISHMTCMAPPTPRGLEWTLGNFRVGGVNTAWGGAWTASMFFKGI